MSPKPWLPAPTSQPFIIGTAMACVLGGSLAMAYALTVSRQVPWTIGYTDNAQARTVLVDGLALKIPERFEPLTGDDPAAPPRNIAAYTDRSTPQRRLKIGLLTSTRPRSPIPALNQAINTFLSESQRRSLKPWQPVAHFRAGSFVGAWYAGIGRTPQGEDSHMIAVVTQDARRYWLIHLNHLVSEPSLVFEAMKVNSHLIRLIIGSVSGGHLRQATPTDFRHAGLSWLIATDTAGIDALLPAGLSARVSTANIGEEPILLIPENTQASLHLLRVRGVLDTQAVESQTDLSPQKWLSQVFEDQAGRPPRAEELWSGRVGNIELWRLSLIINSGTLVRQTWYARLGRGRAVLIEAVCEPQALVQCGAWIGPLLSAWHQRLEANAYQSAAAPSAVENAAARGVRIAQWQRQHLSEKFSPGWSYYLTEQDGGLIGWQIERVLPRAQDDFMAIQGELRLNWRLGTYQARLTRTWQASLDGQNVAMDSRTVIHNPQTGSDTVTQDRVRIDTQRLTTEQVDAKGQTTRKTIDAPQSLILPLTDEYWPIEPGDNWHPDGVLVWMTSGHDAPQPYWVDRLDHEQPPYASQADTDTPAAVIRIRPLMSLDADLLFLDADRAMLRYKTQQPSGTFAGTTVEARKASLEELLAAFPDLEPTLIQWQQDLTAQ